jgi:hypothetical protein
MSDGINPLSYRFDPKGAARDPWRNGAHVALRRLLSLGLVPRKMRLKEAVDLGVRH